MVTAQLLATELLLAQTPTPGPNENSTGAEFGKAGPVGLVLILLLLVALILLIRSMNRHMRKLPKSFPEDTPETPTESGPTEKTGN